MLHKPCPDIPAAGRTLAIDHYGRVSGQTPSDHFLHDNPHWFICIRPRPRPRHRPRPSPRPLPRPRPRPRPRPSSLVPRPSSLVPRPRPPCPGSLFSLYPAVLLSATHATSSRKEASSRTRLLKVALALVAATWSRWASIMGSTSDDAIINTSSRSKIW
eukprot:760211-Hanusia_phi.AAC.2